MNDRSDDELLTASTGDPEAFGLFYDRHVHSVIGYFMSRTRDPEVAADLAAETFAAALQGRRGFDPRKGPAAGWLYGIARRKLADSLHRGRVEDRARRRLGLRRLELDDEALERIVAVADAQAGGSRAVALLDELPEDQREAVAARVLAEDDYPAIAARLDCSESVIRKRVSRGLAGLRARMEESPS
jgi:RNA polymerase sigma-70 factor (ECF subfamily)